MSHSFTYLLCHIVFATKHRRACLDDEIQPRLYAFLAQWIRQQNGIPLAVNGMPEHIHVLARLNQNKALAQVLRGLKADSSRWLHQTFPDLAGFGWQTGYAAFTVSRSQEDRVRIYIENQKEHHRDRSYLDEFRSLLKAHGLEISEEQLEDLELTFPQDDDL
jgi:REP element-mobilizing transposase RayT